MRFSRVAACLVCATLHAALLPTLHLEPETIRIFDAYVARFEKEVVAPYSASGKLWMDNSSVSGKPGVKPIVEPRENADIPGGSIHHFSGSMRIRGGTIEDVRRIMEDYPNYPRYFKPDVIKGSGTPEPDSTPMDEHFLAHLTLAESTLWFNVEYNCIYDTHYRRLDERRWQSKSTSSSVKELRDVKNPGEGDFPDGDGHGFLWRTNTYWFVRQNNGGIDLELDSITLSRPNVSGFAWWGAKRSHDAVDKMLRDTRTAVEALHYRDL